MSRIQTDTKNILEQIAMREKRKAEEKKVRKMSKKEMKMKMRKKMKKMMMMTTRG